MAEQKLRAPAAERSQGSDDELVPLAVAATVAYFHVTEAAHQVSSQADLAAVVPLVAIALSTVAPILGQGGALSAAEVRERLYGKRPDLDGLMMRRGDLRAAMVTLREARETFGSWR